MTADKLKVLISYDPSMLALTDIIILLKLYGHVYQCSKSSLQVEINMQGVQKNFALMLGGLSSN